jgi:hypothetical protein
MIRRGVASFVSSILCGFRFGSVYSLHSRFSFPFDIHLLFFFLFSFSSLARRDWRALPAYDRSYAPFTCFLFGIMGGWRAVVTFDSTAAIADSVRSSPLGSSCSVTRDLYLSY